MLRLLRKKLKKSTANIRQIFGMRKFLEQKNKIFILLLYVLR